MAQTLPEKGNVEGNIQNHKKLIDLAISEKADLIIFPELSLTGYEPTLANQLSMDARDTRLNAFQTISDANNITIGVGAPVKSRKGICIGMVIFQPHRPRQVCAKKYLHSDEDPFFVSGENIPFINVKGEKIALAICYELSVDEHLRAAVETGASIYVASVAKSVRGIEKAHATLSETAKQNAMTVLMSNCIGVCDGETCAGKSAIWNTRGEQIGNLSDASEGIILLDTENGDLVARLL